MAAGVRRHRCGDRLPRGPWLGHRGPLRPGSDPLRDLVHPPRRLPHRRRPLRRGVLRDQPARGDGDGPAATRAPRNRLGGRGARRDRPDDAAWYRHRRVRGRGRRRLRHPARADSRGRRGIPGDGHHRQRRLGTYRLLLRSRGPGRLGGHRLLVVAGGAASGRPVPSPGRVLARPGRRRDRTGGPHQLHRVQPPAGALPRRSLQGLLRLRRRHRLGGGGGAPAPGAAVRRPAQRAPCPRPGEGHRDQPGRRKQRSVRAQRAVPGAGDPAGPGQRPAHRGPGGRGRGSRHRDPARRPHRGTGPHQHVRQRTGPRTSAVARLVEVEHRTHDGRCGRRRRHQDGDGHAEPQAAEDAPCRPADRARRLVGRHRPAALRRPRVGHGRRRAASGRRLLLRDQWHQRPRHHRTGRSPHARGGADGGGRPSAPLAAVRQDPGRAQGQGAAPAHVRHGAPRRPGRAHRGNARGPDPLRPSRRRRCRGPRGPAVGARRPRRREGGPGRRHRDHPRPRTGPGRVRLPRPGQPVARDGP